VLVLKFETEMYNQQSICRIIFFSLLLFACKTLFAQEDTIRKGQFIDNKFKINSNIFHNNFQPIRFDVMNSLFQSFPSTTIYSFNFENRIISDFERLSFKQSKSAHYYLNLGSFEHFNNSVSFKANNKLMIDINLGLLKQNTIVNSNKPNFNFTFGTSLEYEMYPWLSLYMYGQLVVPTSKRSNLFIDPLTYLNPLFIQSEISGGVRMKYKNIKADMGFKQIYDTQFNQSNPVKSMNTKISIGF